MMSAGNGHRRKNFISTSVTEYLFAKVTCCKSYLLQLSLSPKAAITDQEGAFGLPSCLLLQ